MATSSLIRLLTALLMLTGLALSSSLAWANEAAQDPQPSPTSDSASKQSDATSQNRDDEQHPSNTSADKPFPPPESDMPYTEYNQEHSGPSSTWIVTRDALVGGIFGALLGTAGYFISGRDWTALVIVYSAAGGIVLGTTVGLVTVLTREDRELSASFRYMEHDLPSTAHVQVLNLNF